jgi:methyl-accepting chemotaxis protein
MNEYAQEAGAQDRPATKRELEFLEKRVLRALEAAQFNCESLQQQLQTIDTATEETFQFVEDEVNRVVEDLGKDIDYLRDDGKILHEVINDIDNEKEELEDRVNRLQDQVETLTRRLDQLAHTQQG